MSRRFEYDVPLSDSDLRDPEIQLIPCLTEDSLLPFHLYWSGDVHDTGEGQEGGVGRVRE